MRSRPAFLLLMRVAAAALVVLVGMASPGAQAPRPPAAAAARPDVPPVRLVLLVVVDQFRADYLTRFGPPRAGLRTLMTRGAMFTNAYFEHGITVTAVGHATMLTGATPSVSGIIDNAWYERASKSNVESITDIEARIVGVEQGGGVGASPRRLLVPTLGDQLKLASPGTAGTAQAPRVIGISLKDRSAILPAGHAADAAYFYRAGRFVTSTYYRQALPAWVEAVNARRMPDAYAGTRWEFEGGSRPYPTDVGASLDAAVIARPGGNELVLAMAKAAVEHEQLGQRGVTDVLSVSFSSNDTVGHAYGPESPEVRDITRQADRQIQELLDDVDRRVGLAHVLVATADHGVASLPEATAALRIPGGRFTPQVVLDAIETALDARFGAATWVERLSLPHVYLDQALLAEKGIDGGEARRVAATAAARVPPWRACTREAVLDGQVTADHISTLITRTYHRDRSGDLHVVLEPHWTTAATGTSHGTVYGYDAHVPLILMGPGVEPGTYHQRVAINDLAPTLATVLGIETPSGSQGRPLVEALRGARGRALPAPGVGAYLGAVVRHARPAGRCAVIRVSDAIVLHDRDLTEHFVRASGPGGQNVNKVATAVQLRVDVAATSLPAPVKARLLRLAGSRVTTEGVLVIEARECRTQAQNRVAARERLHALLEQAATPPRPRHATRPSKASKVRRLDAKQKRGDVKRARRSPGDD